MTNSSFRCRLGASAVILAALGLAACKSDSNEAETIASQTVTVVGLDNTEGRVLTEVYAEALEQAGFRVARRNPVADLATAYSSLTGGTADLVITHTNDLLTQLVAAEPAAAASTSTTEAPTTTAASTTTTPTTEAATTTSGATSDPSATSTAATETTAAATTTTSPVPQVGQAAGVSINLQTNQIGEILPDTLQIGAASNAENKNVIACNGIIAQSMLLQNLSQVAKFADTIRMAGPAEFETGDPFGLPGFEKTYGATFKEFIAVDAGQVGAAISPPEPDPSESTTTVAATVAASDESTTTTVPVPPDIDAECGAFNSLDVTIPDTATVMDDDLTWITTNGVLPLISAKAFSPGVSQIIDQISQTLHTTDLRTMVKQVDVDKIDPNVVASNFLTQAGIGG